MSADHARRRARTVANTTLLTLTLSASPLCGTALADPPAIEPPSANTIADNGSRSGSASGSTADGPDGSTAPPGANDFGCRPSAAHPRPVVLVHGTWGNQNAWDVLAPQLKTEGYCVFSLNYGKDVTSVMGAKPGSYGNGDIRESAEELSDFVDRVLASTGATKVDLVGHSQGGTMSRQYLRFDGGAAKVSKMITIAATNHGTTMNGLITQATGSASGSAAGSSSGSSGLAGGPIGAVFGLASTQQLVGSEFITALNAGGDTLPGIDYTVIATHVDKTSTPPEATFLTAVPGATVDNLWVQDICSNDTTPHGDLPKSPTVAYIVEKALDPSSPATLPCG
ncbi:esterase/lipase family protein [Nocardia inohanensis]|uniref:esterase/lipase family protein n=1 Tax=Nocardia inohanensis TaxID=209246 RepID=UPI0008346974|nr:alpha/beta fold hydrolase [Nocardia inohanensis]